MAHLSESASFRPVTQVLNLTLRGTYISFGTDGFRLYSSYILWGASHNNDLPYLLLYVDDIILTGSSKSLLDRITNSLKNEFPMSDMGRLKYFLGIKVEYNAARILLWQKNYASEIIQRAEMSNCKPISTPADVNSKLSSEAGARISNPKHCRSLAGALQYLTFTRPDISYAMQQVCLFMHDPREQHYTALKRIIRYIQGILSYGLQIYKTKIDSLTAYYDADWAGCPDTRRSTSGYCIVGKITQYR
ncbi:PREDICTED: uncharacterized mitochondrial protein AtMg00810-like [Brassica oleracea var. oleracea]|uniref:uncharacterized mitochondrial protein AtMg00810-like n=1 Tax=Brassica oleracea var. oleracea TaxID=109376 RepID=UPI0006A6E3C1|nr:PREDICTED: uncharacterized mitochondrial protein AtMg00810-like [Brassica oleracea var. oleracea]